MAHASYKPVSTIGVANGSIQLSVVHLACVSSITVSDVRGADGFGGSRSQNQTSEPVSITTTPIVSELGNSTSQVAMEGGDVEFVGSEGAATTNNDSDLEGVLLPGTTIRDLVGDLDKSWGNSKDWMLQLRDGRQLVLPLSLYRSPDGMLVCLSMEEECVQGIAAIANEGQRVSWADEGEGLVESSSVVPGSENEMWELDRKSVV